MRAVLFAAVVVACVLAVAPRPRSDSFMPSPSPMTPYTTAGVAAGVRIWDGKVTSSTSGTWAVDLTAAGCAAVPTVTAQAISPDATLMNSSTATITAVSATAAGGNIFQPNTNTLGGTPYKLAAVAMPVHVIAICR